MFESNSLLRELKYLDASAEPDRETGSSFIGPVLPPTIGFEFDMDYGASKTEPPPPDVNYDLDGEKITTHDSGTDGFRLKGDGNRIEVGTKPFEVTPTGKKEMLTTAKKIKSLTDEIETLCKSAPLHPGTDTDVYKKTNKVKGKIVGRPRCIKHSKLKSPIKCIFPIEGQNTYYRQKLCNVSAAPQATISIPLAKVEALVKRIKASEAFPKNKFPLSGHSGYRLGLRTDALYKAMTAVNLSRNFHIRNKTTLSDGTVISAKNYTPSLQGLLILMVSYLITSELPVDSRDYEPFAKAYLPLNVKNHFHRLLDDLGDDEKKVFKERYYDGVSQFNIFKLAKKDANLAFAKSRKLFPAKATDWTFYFNAAPTWFDFVDKTFRKIPLKREVEPTEANPKHVKGDETLFAPISKTIPYANGSNRVVVEMRRIGTRKLGAGEWEKFMTAIFQLTEDLNA
jgi:hypothetical protein